MTATTDYIDVEVSFGGREVARGRYKVPFSIGRGDPDTNHVSIGTDDHGLSRRHAQVSHAEGRLLLTDTSLNGTLLRGQKLNRQTAELKDGEVFEIRGYSVRISRVRIAPDAPALVEAQVWYLGQKLLVQGIGEMMLVFLRTGPERLSFEPIPLVRGSDLDRLLDRWARPGEQAYGLLYAQHGQCIFSFAPRPEAPKVLVNKAPVRAGETVLHPRDTIQAGAARIELLVPGELSLKCLNPKCERLNPYDHRGHCEYCGFRLNEAETRVIGRP